MRLRLAILSLGPLAAPPALATTWTPLTRSAEGAIVSIDLQSLEARKGWIRVWVQYDFTRVSARPERGLVLLQEIDCNGRTARIVVSRTYAPDGQITAEDLRPGDYTPVVPGSVNERIGKRACAIGDARAGG